MRGNFDHTNTVKYTDDAIIGWWGGEETSFSFILENNNRSTRITKLKLWRMFKGSPIFLFIC